MPIELRLGSDIDQAIPTLRMLSTNAAGAAMPPGDSTSEIRDAYVRWGINCEHQLLAFFNRSSVMELFENPRHRDICAMPFGTQLRSLISAEVSAKAAEFNALADRLEAMRDRLRASPGCPTIVDTNSLLHYQRFDFIRWIDVIGESEARIVIPLRVIEELDEKKYDAKDRLRSVARELLPWLESLFADASCGPVALNGPDESTIEILLSEQPRYRPSDADEEVLDAYQGIRQIAGRAKLVSGDTGMRLRARALNMETCPMPDKYLRVPPSKAE